MVSEKIVINAPNEFVIEAIRMLRDQESRKLDSFDGKKAIVKEELDGVPVLGKVHCVWEEVEESAEKIIFKLLSSTKFKESYGAYTLSSAGEHTTLEIQVHLDAGLSIPFAAELTKTNTSKDTKVRLEKIKKLAEALKQQATKA
jgi:hypothetical protein